MIILEKLLQVKERTAELVAYLIIPNSKKLQADCNESE